jgi:hypothetical protein
LNETIFNEFMGFPLLWKDDRKPKISTPGIAGPRSPPVHAGHDLISGSIILGRYCKQSPPGAADALG